MFYLNDISLLNKSCRIPVKQRQLLWLICFLFPPGAGHLDQQDSNTAECASGHGGILASHSNGFQAGLILEKIKWAFTVLSNIICQLYLFRLPGNPLEEPTIGRDKAVLRACPGMKTFANGCSTFIFMGLILNAYVAHCDSA